MKQWLYLLEKWKYTRERHYSVIWRCWQQQAPSDMQCYTKKGWGTVRSVQKQVSQVIVAMINIKERCCVCLEQVWNWVLKSGTVHWDLMLCRLIDVYTAAQRNLMMAAADSVKKSIHMYRTIWGHTPGGWWLFSPAWKPQMFTTKFFMCRIPQMDIWSRADRRDVTENKANMWQGTASSLGCTLHSHTARLIFHHKSEKLLQKQGSKRTTRLHGIRFQKPVAVA